MRREQRLRRREDFDAIYRRGRSWANELLVLRALPNGLDQSRFGFSISKRVGNAVVRNRVKRRLREIVRLAEVQRGWDLVFIARPPAAAACFEALDAAARGLCARARLVRDGSSRPHRPNRGDPGSV